MHYKISKRDKNNLKTLEALKPYSLNVYIFQPSKNFFITVEYDIKICLFWAGFFPGFFNRVFKGGFTPKTHRVFWVCARVSEPWLVQHLLK